VARTLAFIPSALSGGDALHRLPKEVSCESSPTQVMQLVIVDPEVVRDLVHESHVDLVLQILEDLLPQRVAARGRE
jgi:hypothetical protein